MPVDRDGGGIQRAVEIQENAPPAARLRQGEALTIGGDEGEIADLEIMVRQDGGAVRQGHALKRAVGRVGRGIVRTIQPVVVEQILGSHRSFPSIHRSIAGCRCS